MQKPIYSRTLWGAFLALTLSWQTACNKNTTANTGSDTRSTTPAPEEEDPDPSTTPAPEEELFVTRGSIPLFIALAAAPLKGIKWLLDKCKREYVKEELKLDQPVSIQEFIIWPIIKNTQLTTADKKELLNTLVEKGLDINARDALGDPLLSILVSSLGKTIDEAERREIQEAIDLLLAIQGSKQSLYYGDLFKKTPWEIAANENEYEVAQKLISAMTAEEARQPTILPNGKPGPSQIKRATSYIRPESKPQIEAKIREAFHSIGIELPVSSYSTTEL